MKYGWTGLLVEPNPDFLKKLKPKNRELLILRKCPRHFNTICIYSLGHFLISISWYFNPDIMEISGKFMGDKFLRNIDTELKFKIFQQK